MDITAQAPQITQLCALAVGSGIDAKSLSVRADFPIDGVPASTELAAKFQSIGQGISEYQFARSVTSLDRGKLTISIADRQGNITRVERTIRVGGK